MAAFGPAAIVASVAIGAGETIVVVRTGAWSGYELLWLVLLSVLVKGICVTYLLGRYTAVSGEFFGNRLVRLPGPRGWLLLVIIALELAASGPLWAAIVRPCGELIFYLAQQFVGEIPWAHGPAVISTALVISVLVMSLRQSFERLERQQVVICGILVLGTMLGTLMVRPDFMATLRGALSFGSLPAEIPEWAPDSVRRQPFLTLATTFGYVGGSVMTYIVYANWIGMHRWGICGHPDIEDIRRRAAEGTPKDYLPSDAGSARRIRILLAPLRWDVTIGALVLAIVSSSFMLAGAVVLYPMLAQGEVEGAFRGWSLLTEQSHIWRSIHPWLTWVYYICVLAALWGTLHALPEIYTRVTQEFCAAIWPDQQWKFDAIKRAVCALLFLITIPLLWIETKFDTLTSVVAFLTTNFAVALVMAAALYLNHQLPRALRTRWWMFLLGVGSVVILVIASCVSGWGLWQKLAIG